MCKFCDRMAFKISSQTYKNGLYQIENQRSQKSSRACMPRENAESIKDPVFEETWSYFYGYFSFF